MKNYEVEGKALTSIEQACEEFARIREDAVLQEDYETARPDLETIVDYLESFTSSTVLEVDDWKITGLNSDGVKWPEFAETGTSNTYGGDVIEWADAG